MSEKRDKCEICGKKSMVMGDWDGKWTCIEHCLPELIKRAAEYDAMQRCQTEKVGEWNHYWEKERVSLEHSIAQLERKTGRLESLLNAAKAVLNGMEFEKVDTMLDRGVAVCHTVGTRAHARNVEKDIKITEQEKLIRTQESELADYGRARIDWAKAARAGMQFNKDCQDERDQAKANEAKCIVMLAEVTRGCDRLRDELDRLKSVLHEDL